MIDQAKEKAFQVVGRRSTCSLETTVVIAGVPRSGTTWLLELLRTLPDYKAVNEPLMYEEAREENGFSWRTYVEPEEPATEKRAYLKQVLMGHLGISPAWHFKSEIRLAQLFEHGTHDRLVVKFCRLNRMLHWFCSEFEEVRGPIFIIRHPCAVVASMLRHGGWEDDYLQGENAREIAAPEGGLPKSLQDPFEPVLENITTKTQALATLWCLDHYIPLVLHAEKGYPWILVPYERLLAHGHDELLRVTESVGVTATPEMLQQFRDPSSSVKDQLHQDTKRQLSKWRRHLSAEQIDEVMNIVEEVELSKFYSRALEPNYSALNRRQQSGFLW
jgi:hypothetical protein